MRFGKTLAATIGILVLLNCVLLSFEFLPASWADQFDLSVLSADNAIRALPGTAAFSITEIVLFDRTGRDFLCFSAPVTSYDNRGPHTGAATVFSGFFSVWIDKKRLSASLTNHFYAVFHSHIVPQMSYCASSGSEMIGALQAGWDEVVGIELDPEYVAIAEARLAYWTGQGLQHPLFRVSEVYADAL
jgi:hypothetical protein